MYQELMSYVKAVRLFRRNLTFPPRTEKDPVNMPASTDSLNIPDQRLELSALTEGSGSSRSHELAVEMVIGSNCEIFGGPSELIWQSNSLRM
jgi:hypothetical protein